MLKVLKPRVARLAQRITAPASNDRLRGRKAMNRTARIKARDLYTCAGCGRVTPELEVDHIVPLHLGGADRDANLELLCIPCHRKKTASEAIQRGNLHG